MLVQGYGIRNPGIVHYEAFPLNSAGIPIHQASRQIRQRLLNKRLIQFADKTKTLWRKHKAIEKLSQILNMTETCGYVTFVNTGVPDIGCEEYDINVHLKKPKTRTANNKERRRSSGVSQSKTSTSDIGSITSEDIVSEPRCRFIPIQKPMTHVILFVLAAKLLHAECTRPVFTNRWIRNH